MVTHIVKHHSGVAVAKFPNLSATRLNIVLGDASGEREGRGGAGRRRNTLRYSRRDCGHFVQSIGTRTSLCTWHG